MQLLTIHIVNNCMHLFAILTDNNSHLTSKIVICTCIYTNLSCWLLNLDLPLHKIT